MQDSVMNTKSQMSRKNGNKIFKSISDDLDPNERRGRLQKCLGCYNIAMDSAYTTADKIAAAKNLGMASYQMSVSLEELNEEEVAVNFYFFEALKQFSHALEQGQEQSLDWRRHLIRKLAECVVWWINPAHPLSEKRGGTLEAVADKIPACAMAAVNLTMADTLFKSAVKRQDEGNHKECLRCLHECYHPLEEAKQCSPDDIEQTEIASLEDDIVFEMCMAEATKAVETGESLLRALVIEEESLNIDMIWDIIDWFQQAIILAREKDIEVEAIASSNLGYIYDKILKIKDKAKNLFRNAFKLAHALEPKNVTTEPWYKQAAEAIRRYQEEVKLEEEKKWESERQKYMKELKPELDKLNELNTKFPHLEDDAAKMQKNSKEFLENIYKQFKPKNPKFKMAKIDKKGDKNTVRKAFQIAVTHYHPDRQKEEDGLKWKVLAEEVCKELTRRYELMK